MQDRRARLNRRKRDRELVLEGGKTRVSTADCEHCRTSYLDGGLDRVVAVNAGRMYTSRRRRRSTCSGRFAGDKRFARPTERQNRRRVLRQRRKRHFVPRIA